MKQHFHRGFSLIELMITLLILAILSLVVVPGFQSLISHNRLTSTTNQLLGSLQLARSEAIQSGDDIKVSAIDNDWNQGWTLQTTASGAAPLRVYDDLPGDIRISTVKGSASLTYSAIGATGSSECFTLANSAGERSVEVISSGLAAASEVSCAP
ncbi:GspH/FimT family pseudopilin [Marinobacterium lutimaris]|uniref:Type II secretion system protein H n=1 Tax=Marinobacterium lutimaris TaxID=568106 RepID=A0A1H5Z6N2_9GAMM|nr:GspH/FimT family pseudopilin [Marinobacterium lutimaris]SEG32058.1 type IV fimbrial biogenesis protein FimT [Marinobacterium lutimaris]